MRAKENATRSPAFVAIEERTCLSDALRPFRGGGAAVRQRDLWLRRLSGPRPASELAAHAFSVRGVVCSRVPCSGHHARRCSGSHRRQRRRRLPWLLASS